MHQNQSWHLSKGDYTQVTMTTLPNAVLGKITFLNVTLGDTNTNIHGTPEQLLDLCDAFEQASRAWQMELDGVNAEARAKVFDRENVGNLR